jgi:hypothetical protein
VHGAGTSSQRAGYVSTLGLVQAEPSSKFLPLNFGFLFIQKKLETNV